MYLGRVFKDGSSKTSSCGCMLKAFSVISICECLYFADCLRVNNILQKRFKVEKQLLAGLGTIVSV